MWVTPQCGHVQVGLDIQSDFKEAVRCQSRAVISIQLPTGERYDYCESCANILGIELSV